jgi:hypothetical protein
MRSSTARLRHIQAGNAGTAHRERAAPTRPGYGLDPRRVRPVASTEGEAMLAHEPFVMAVRAR